MRKQTAVFLLLLNAIISAAGYIWINVALDAGLSAAAIVMLRGYIASIGCLCLFGKQIFRISRKDFWQSMLLGAVNFAGFILSAQSAVLSTPSNVSLILSSCMVCVPFVNWIINKQRPSLKVCFCALVCLFGIAVLTGAFRNSFSLDFGVILALASTLAFSVHSVLSSNYSKHIHYQALVFYSALWLAIGGTVMFIPELPAFSLSALHLPSALFSVLGLGLLASFTYFIIQMKTLAYVPVTTGILLLSTDALFTSLLSVLLGYDTLTAELLVGGLLITAAIIIQELNIGMSFSKKQNADLL